MYHQRFKTTDERFDEKYTIEPNGCWLWKAGKREKFDRHPVFWVKDRYLRSSHFAWERANGRPLPEGQWVLHTCDQPRCVNPGHFFLGDQTANMQDRSRKGRGNHPFGVRNGRARITRFIADEIRRLYVTGISQQKLADRFGLGQSTVSHIILQDTWK